MTEIGSGKTRAPMDPSMRFVCERFDYVRERAMEAFARDPDFRDLCEEYGACATTVARLEERGSSALRREYGALLLRLERELLRYLEEHPDDQDS
jgi:hypothetical protein